MAASSASTARRGRADARPAHSIATADVRLLPPVTPTKIVCVGLNYHAHIAESVTVVTGAIPRDEPLLFLKPPSAVIASGDPIRYPAGVTRLDPEAELAMVIGRRARAVPERRRWITWPASPRSTT